jgi:hypothetical protein
VINSAIIIERPHGNSDRNVANFDLFIAATEATGAADATALGKKEFITFAPVFLTLFIAFPADLAAILATLFNCCPILMLRFILFS